jgi:hypothetical protein
MQGHLAITIRGRRTCEIQDGINMASDMKLLHDVLLVKAKRQAALQMLNVFFPTR